jgi:hypothetical protein
VDSGRREKVRYNFGGAGENRGKHITRQMSDQMKYSSKRLQSIDCDLEVMPKTRSYKVQTRAFTGIKRKVLDLVLTPKEISAKGLESREVCFVWSQWCGFVAVDAM